MVKFITPEMLGKFVTSNTSRLGLNLHFKNAVFIIKEDISNFENFPERFKTDIENEEQPMKTQIIKDICSFYHDRISAISELVLQYCWHYFITSLDSFLNKILENLKDDVMIGEVPKKFIEKTINEIN
jgi:hypothetical protein